MEAPKQEPKNPLGLSLDFMFGRGYLWAERQRLSDWIALESLRMEIPDLKFPFDARGGLQRFRHTRCLVREVEFAISEVGLGDLLRSAASHLEGFQDLEVRFLEDAVHVSLKLSRFGSDSHLSFRAALIPPEPARADEVHLSLYDYRAFGPMPYPARLVVHELVTSLLNTPVLRVSGRGKSFTVGVAGDIIRFRPLKLLLLHIFPRVGWKLPDLSGVVLEGAKIRPGVMTIRAVDDDPGAAKALGAERRGDFELSTSEEGARALAAYEAKELFSHADNALFDGELRQALSLLSNYRDVYGLHPELVARLLDCLVAEGSPGNLAEVEAIRRELVAEDPEDLRAALVAPLLALARRRDEDAVEAFDRLAEELQTRRQTRDWILCELALAKLLADDQPKEAANRLRQVLKRDPRHRVALEMLRELYERIDESARLEEILKRLTGVYTDRETLQRTYLELARHLMDRQGDLGEARMYLEKVLRLEPTELEALHALGESYVLGGEPLRALKAFGSAARTAEMSGRKALASKLHHRVGELWFEELEDPNQALLGFRRAVALSSEESTADEAQDDRAVGPMERARQLRRAAEMCEELSRDEEATRYWMEALPLLERMEKRRGQEGEGGADIDEGSWRDEVVEVHRRLAEIYDRRQRPSAAATHFRRLLEYHPEHGEALVWLENHLGRSGRPDELIALYDDLLERAADDQRRFHLLEKLGDLYTGLGHPEDGQEHFRRALRLAPENRRVRKKLVDLLSDHRRWETLCDALNSVLLRTRDREQQIEISLEVASARESSGDLERAARAYLEALKLQPGHRQALEGACRVLEAYVEREGVKAEAPVGSRPAGYLLEKTMIRFAEVVPSAARERELLLKVAMLADERGDGAAASEARDRAALLSQRGHEEEGEDFQDVDARLDAMLDRLDEEVPRADGPTSAPPETRRAMPTPLNRNTEHSKPAAIADSSKEPTSGADEANEATEEDKSDLAAFRRRFQAMIKKPSKAPTRKIPPRNKRVPSGTKKVPSQTRKMPPHEEGSSSEWELPRPEKMPSASGGPTADEASAVGGEEEKSFQKGDGSPATVKMSLDSFGEFFSSGGDKKDDSDESVATSSTEDLKEETEPTKSGQDWSFQFPQPGLAEDTSEVDTSPEIHPVEMARDALEEVRRGDDPRDVAEAIENVLTLAESTDTDVLDDREKQALAREAGELLYYELEDDEGARPFLETVHRLDPDGEGSEPAVINALEAIYEERGEVNARLDLLEQRLEGAETPEMRTTYRLLLAQLVWEERSDADQARRWLQEVLESDEHHEAAHRLLAEMARDEEDWEDVARHLQVVARHSGGGIDAVEARRELADVFLRRLERPKDAIEHYERVLEEAPGDSNALEGIKEAQALAGSWEDYVGSLARELGLLLGRPGQLSAEELGEIEVSSVASALRVPASQIVADAAHVVETEMERPELARTLWGVTCELWPEHVEALQRRIELDRQTGCDEALARDLETYAAMVLDPSERFEALVEAAELWAQTLDEPETAQPLYAEAVALAAEADETPEGVDAARRALERLRQREECR